jgi:predicted secreted protein
MGSLAISGKGTIIKQGDGADPEVFTTIAEVKSIGGPSFSSDTIDTTSHDTAGAWRDFIASLIDPGELTFDLNFVPTHGTHDGTTGLLSLLVSRARTNFQFVFPDTAATTWELAGIVTGFEIGAPTDDVLSASVTIKLVGAPVLT